MPRNERVLVTGGAGFIGSHLVDQLLVRGYTVRVLDSLVMQVHGAGKNMPRYLSDSVEFIVGDVRNPEVWYQALKGIDVVFHQAAAVGVGQSMYQISRYISVNTLGTAYLLDFIAKGKHRIRKLIVASSMSIYGEGEYMCESCGKVSPKLRTIAQLERKEWDVLCPLCSKGVSAIPTSEEKPLYPTSIYAISKRDQEEMCLAVGRAYDLPTICLRYFNVYGPRQALSNPYTGVVAIFASRLLNEKPPIIFEDALQTRDLVSVQDVVQANMLALETDTPSTKWEVFNVGTGRQVNVLEIAESLSRILRRDIKPKITGMFRAGDIRHCYADISRIANVLGYMPRVSFDQGIYDLCRSFGQDEAVDSLEEAMAELQTRKLIK